jgi:hypothetical protein
MKNIHVIPILALIVIIPLITFTGCNKHDELTSPNKMDFDSPAFALVDYTDVTNAIDDGTVDIPMLLNSSLFNYNFLNMTDFRPGNMGIGNGGRWMQMFDWGKHLGFGFRGMNLSDDQKTAIKDLVTSYHDSFKVLVKDFADANHSIIDSANAKRKIIVNDFKAGQLTRLEAVAKIKTLNDDTRSAIENNPASKTIKDKMCKLRSDLITAIAGKLVGDQVTKWNDIISKLKNPCQ